MMKLMKTMLLGVLMLLTSCGVDETFISPNGKIKLSYNENEFDNPSFRITYVDKETEYEILEIPAIGILCDKGVGGGLKLKEVGKGRLIHEAYNMISGKRKECSNEATEYVYVFTDSVNTEIKMVWRLYNDGVAFRYEVPQLEETLSMDEQTVYRIPEGRKRWMQKYTSAYEDFYLLMTAGGGDDHYWGYPALLQVENDVWALVSEAGVERMNSASFLKNEGNATDYKVTLGKNEKSVSGNWTSPWRVVIAGSLSDVVESTLITDVCDGNRIGNTDWIQPGCVSWIYWAYNHGSKDFQIVKEYIDMAAELSLPYILIDWEWDVMSNGGTIEDALEYARQKNVRPLLWYNSSTVWVDDAAGPLYKLNDLENREKEFSWLEQQGVAGVKIDFFNGDTQATMEYCMDLLEDAAKHNLMVNFHGATIPRGWQRTFPNMMSIEGVYGAEWYNNAPVLTDKAARHNATLPFTRNVVGPMDYTPCTFSDSQYPHITTHAHELALTVVFESALQHLADRPKSYLSQPQDVKDFLSALPAAWEDTRLLSGYPGEYVVMARKHGMAWYIGGINGTEQTKRLEIDWAFLEEGNYKVTLFQDSDNRGEPWKIEQFDGGPENFVSHLDLQCRGGFVAVVEKLN